MHRGGIHRQAVKTQCPLLHISTPLCNVPSSPAGMENRWSHPLWPLETLLKGTRLKAQPPSSSSRMGDAFLELEVGASQDTACAPALMFQHLKQKQVKAVDLPTKSDGDGDGGTKKTPGNQETNAPITGFGNSWCLTKFPAAQMPKGQVGIFRWSVWKRGHVENNPAWVSPPQN